jgi:hypothetical protein
VKLLTTARDLQRRKAREKLGLFVAEGVRSVEALLASPVVVHGILVTSAFPDDPREAAIADAAEARGVPVKGVSASEFESAASTESPRGVGCGGHSGGDAAPPPRGRRGICCWTPSRIPATWARLSGRRRRLE